MQANAQATWNPMYNPMQKTGRHHTMDSMPSQSFSPLSDSQSISPIKRSPVKRSPLKPSQGPSVSPLKRALWPEALQGAAKLAHLLTGNTGAGSPSMGGGAEGWRAAALKAGVSLLS